jgi:hypothetical protein
LRFQLADCLDDIFGTRRAEQMYHTGPQFSLGDDGVTAEIQDIFGAQESLDWHIG